MEDLERSLLNPDFSHIYLEKSAKDHPNTKRILSHFKNAVIVEVDHYKDIFCRGHQSFNLQKKSTKLILAVKKGNLVYEGAEVCENFGNTHFYYTSSMMNCVYDCEYCYLQGMYPSANIVIFVNIEDIFDEIEGLLKKHPLYLCISYDTDLLAFEGVTSFVSMWMKFASMHPFLKIELRTKSANFKSIEDIEPLSNVILAWTLSPSKIIEDYEIGTPPLSLRLKSIKGALEKGWKVRLCFDPILYVKGWKEHYGEFIEEIFKSLPPEKIYDVSVGVFRVSKEYLKKMQKERSYSPVLSYPFECRSGVCSYREEHIKDMTHFMYDRILEYIPKEKIYV